MLALHCLHVTVLTDQSRRCCEYSITPNWLLISVNPKHADSVRIKCICSHFRNEHSYCNAVQCLNAPNMPIQLFWKVLSCVHMLYKWWNGEMCRCSHSYIYTRELFLEINGLRMCLLCITCRSISVEKMLDNSSLQKFSKWRLDFSGNLCNLALASCWC